MSEDSELLKAWKKAIPPASPQGERESACPHPDPELQWVCERCGDRWQGPADDLLVRIGVLEAEIEELRAAPRAPTTTHTLADGSTVQHPLDVRCLSCLGPTREQVEALRVPIPDDSRAPDWLSAVHYNRAIDSVLALFPVPAEPK